MKSRWTIQRRLKALGLVARRFVWLTQDQAAQVDAWDAENKRKVNEDE